MQRNGSLFRSLNRRGSSPLFAPFVSVESFNSLLPQAAPDGRPVPPPLPRKLRESRQSRCSACIAVKEKPAARRDSRSSVAEDMLFFTGPQKIRPVPQAARLPARRSVFRFKSSETAARNSAAPGKRLSEERGKGACAFAARGHSKKRFRPAYCVSTICTVGSSMRISSTAPFSLRPSTTARAFSCRA